MKIEIISSPLGEDVLLNIGELKILLACHELQELKVAIEKYQEEQPFRTAEEGTGG